jgi:hypothetical protein
MRRLLYASTVAAGIALAVPTVQITAQMQDQDRVVPNGGIMVSGWQGAVDAASAKNNHTIKDSKFWQEAGVLKIAAGPAAVYWNPANSAKGDYTVKGTFSEPAYQSANASHPHPYGPFIGGTKMGETGMSLLYCTAYGNGNFIVRGFTNATPPEWGPSRRATPNAAVHKAEGVGKPVTQDIALSVKGDEVSCTINGTEVWKGTKADVVGPGKLESTDGIFGIRVSHNVDVEVKGFGKS